MQSNSLMEKLKQVERLTDKEKSFLQVGEDTGKSPREIPPTLERTPSNRGRGEAGKEKPVASTKRRTASTSARKPTAPKASIDLDPGVVPYAPSTFSMPCVVLDALRDASHERKKARSQPSTQQDIVRAALIEWLTKEGHWPPPREPGEGR